MEKVFKKINKTISLIQTFQNILPRSPLIAAFKSIIRPHLDYEDKIHDLENNSSFYLKLESVQYNLVRVRATVRVRVNM